MNYHEHLSPLPTHADIYIGRQEFVVSYAAGKKVLHLGCVDEGLTREKYAQGLLLHDRIQKVASELWGIDNDAPGLDWMRQHGYTNLIHADIEKLATLPEIMSQTFDLILLTEVMEHLDNPGHFLQAVHPLLAEQTELLITVPNAASLANLMEYWQGRELVHPDHNFWFSYRTAVSLLGKFGYQVVRSAVYTQYDYHHSILGPVRRWLGRIFTLGHRPIAVQTVDVHLTHNHPPRLRGWLRMAGTTLLYRYLLSRNPFFADGLIFIVKAGHRDSDA